MVVTVTCCEPQDALPLQPPESWFNGHAPPCLASNSLTHSSLWLNEITIKFRMFQFLHLHLHNLVTCQLHSSQHSCPLFWTLPMAETHHAGSLTEQSVLRLCSVLCQSLVPYAAGRVIQWCVDGLLPGHCLCAGLWALPPFGSPASVFGFRGFILVPLGRVPAVKLLGRRVIG